MLGSGVHKPVSVSPQCLAIVLNRTNAPSNRGPSGHRIFQDLQEENRGSFWNPALVESVLSLEFVGFMRPGTLLVAGSELHLECLRGAWARRVLKPPRGYTIKSLGDIGGIEMQAVPQTQFIPLPEVLCLLISGLNRVGQPATFETITSSIYDQYSGMNIPRREVLYATLAALAAEGKIYCMGEHYFMSTPMMYQQYQAAFMSNPTGNWMQTDSAQPVSARAYNKQQEMCSRECQTGASIVNAVPAYKPPPALSTKRDQATTAHEDAVQQARQQKTDVARSRSLKEEKPGFFKRLFRRSKSRDTKSKHKVKDLNDNKVPEAKRASSSENSHYGSQQTGNDAPKPAPIITFSAQFPPTEWLHDPRHLRHNGGTQGLFAKSRKGKEKNPKASYKERNSIWIDFEPANKGSRRIRTDGRFSSQRYCTFPENLAAATGQFSPKPERKKGKNRLSKYMSSSSECLHCPLPSDSMQVGFDTDKGTRLPSSGEKAAPVRLRNNSSQKQHHANHHQHQRYSYKHREKEDLKSLPVSEPCQAVDSNTYTVNYPNAPLAVPTDIDLDTTTELCQDRSSIPTPSHHTTPNAENFPAPERPNVLSSHTGSANNADSVQNASGQPHTSDSALSASPVVTEMSSGTSSNKYSSWSGSESKVVEIDEVQKKDPLDHTYINVKVEGQELNLHQEPLPSPVLGQNYANYDRTYENISKHMESTRFENITAIEEEEVGETAGELQISKAVVTLTLGNNQPSYKTEPTEISPTQRKLAATYISAV